MSILFIAMTVVSLLVVVNYLFFKKKTVIKLSLLSSTELDIEYTFNRERGILSINKSFECRTPVISPTPNGWRLTVPFTAKYEDLVDYFKTTRMNRKIKTTHWLGLDLFSFLFYGSYEGKEVFSISQDVKDFLISKRVLITPHFNNFLKAYPDVHFSNLFYVQPAINVKRINNEHPQPV